MRSEMTALADEHPRGILLYNTHCVYVSSFSNFSYFFPQVSRQEQKDSFPHPNKSPHTEVNNINTCVSGVSAGALLKLIFQNVFSALPAATGKPSHPQLPDSECVSCDMALGQESCESGFLRSASSQATGECSFQQLLQSSTGPAWLLPLFFNPMLGLMTSDYLIISRLPVKVLLPVAGGRQQRV